MTASWTRDGQPVLPQEDTIPGVDEQLIAKEEAAARIKAAKLIARAQGHGSPDVYGQPHRRDLSVPVRGHGVLGRKKLVSRGPVCYEN